MIATLNDHLFLALNASVPPDAAAFALAKVAAAWLIFAVAALVPALWVWGPRGHRGALLATVIGVCIALVANQLLGLLWYEPRPFMAHLGHTLMAHAADNSFPSDHATFMWSLGFGLMATGASRRWGIVVCLLGVVVAWARVYLGLHFPLDMAASFGVGLAGSALASAILPATERWLVASAEQLYEAVLATIHLPPTVFPRHPRSQAWRKGLPPSRS